MVLQQKLDRAIIDSIDGEYYAFEMVIGKFPNITYMKIPITYEEFNTYKSIPTWFKKWVISGICGM